MKKIYLFAFIMAVIVALAVYLFTKQLQANSLRDDRPKQQIVVAAVEIPADSLIQSEMVTLLEVPAETVHPQSIRSLTDAVGKINQYPIAPQEALLSSRLKDRTEEADKLSYALPSGHRAITLNVDSTTGVAGYLTQGDRVDLVVNTIIDGSSTSRFQAENLIVIRLGDKRVDQNQVAYQNVTLAATPEQILMINHAMHNGRITLVLRPVTDKEPSGVLPFTEDSALETTAGANDGGADGTNNASTDGTSTDGVAAGDSGGSASTDATETTEAAAADSENEAEEAA